jgi:eukaryotic-like serine/threonine-protein kinase
VLVSFQLYDRTIIRDTVALTPGTKLGPYEIQSPLGAGGMGEVYRARDTRLERTVAVKILPESLANEPDRLRRFAQEARVLSALNHPNLLCIYDVGTEGGIRYLVSEFLEGETLRECIGNAPLPRRRSADYALQIASGLAAAHNQGIIHRDLKPENIFVTRDQRIKILDFGLAKQARVASATDGPTLTGSTPTQAGTVLGTIGYMSPEQVRGEAADHRSDIFSFGAILYEMVCGRRAFKGESSVETMNAILKEDPPELNESSPTVSPGMDRIIRRCLEKAPERRFQSASDLAFAIETLPESSSTKHVAGIVPTVSVFRRRSAWLIAALILVLGVLAFIAGRKLTATNGSGARFATGPVLHRLTFRRGTVWNARFAPDGNSVIYGAAWEGKPVEIFESRIDLAEARALGITGADVFAISDKGEMAVSLGRQRSISGFGFKGTLARLSLTGGVPREVTERVESADWGPDGSLAVSYHTEGKARLEFPIGTLRYESATWISHVRVSPKGDMVAFIDHDAPVGDGGVVRVVGSNLNAQLTRDYGSAQGLAWSPRGDEIWYTAADAGGSSRSLHAVDLLGHERSVYRVPGTLTIQDIARDGRVLLVHELIWAGILAHVPGEQGERELGWLDWSISRKLSNDGKWLLFDETGDAPGDQQWIFLRRTDGSPPVRLGDGAFCDLSADGKWVAAAPTDSSSQIYLLPTGAGEMKKLPVGGLKIYRVWWLPDQEHVVVLASHAGESLRGYVVDIKTGGARPFTPGGVRLQAVSPDGKFVAGAGGDRRTYLFPLDGGPAQSLQTKGDERVIGWSSDGKTVYAAATGETGTSIYRIDIATGRRGLFRDISPLDKTGVTYISAGSVTPDGQYYEYSYNRQISELFIIDGLK